MKKKQFVILFGVVVFVFLLTIFGCSETDNEVSMDKTEYLSVDHPIDFNQLTSSEKEIVFKAFSRFTIKTSKEGYVIIKQKSGKEINISENIFAFYKKMFDEHNRSIPVKISTRYALPSDSDYVGDVNEALDSAGCVIYSIQGVLGRMGTNIPYDDIKQNLISRGLFNDGVAYTDMYAVLNCYFNASFANPPYEQKYDENKYYIMSIWKDQGNGERSYHSVEFRSSNDGHFIYYDYQINDIGTCDMNNVFQFFSIYRKY